MSIKIARPKADEYTANYATYIDRIKTDDLAETLKKGLEALVEFVQAIPAEKLDYRYQEGKWTTKEILVHLMDAERIFAYRALCFSRHDQTLLPGFDENEYVPWSNAAERTLESIMGEYTALRRSTIEFYKNISGDMSQRWGIACGRQISVRALGYAIAGHELHHMDVIREKYL
jgi:hypothetical protein